MRRRRWLLLACASAAACGNLISVQPANLGPDAGIDSGLTNATDATDEPVPDGGGPDVAIPISCLTFFDASIAPDADPPRCLDFDPTSVLPGPEASLGFDTVVSNFTNDGLAFADSPLAGGKRAFAVTTAVRTGATGTLVVQPTLPHVTFALDFTVDDLIDGTQAGIASIRLGDGTPACPLKRGSIFVYPAPVGFGFGQVRDGGLNVGSALLHQPVHLAFRIDLPPRPYVDDNLYTTTVHFLLDVPGQTQRGNAFNLESTGLCLANLYLEVGTTDLTPNATMAVRIDNVTYRNE